MNRRELLSALGASVVAACRGTGAETVADRFVQAYYVEAQQQSAMEMATGVARDKLAKELESVAEVRRAGGPGQARSRVGWQRRALAIEGDHGRAEYDIEVDIGGTASKRRALLLLRKEGGSWRVSNYDLIDDSAPSRR